MYFSRITLNGSRAALSWAANSYRVHQKLMMACDRDPRVLFRIESSQVPVQILVQSWHEPDWQEAFKTLHVLACPVERKPFDLQLAAGAVYHFRLVANPVVKKDREGKKQGRRVGLLKENDQLAWLERKLSEAGAHLLACQVVQNGLQRSKKNADEDGTAQTHLSVRFEGTLVVRDSSLLAEAVKNGIGPAKGYGFGLLSLAREPG